MHRREGLRLQGLGLPPRHQVSGRRAGGRDSSAAGGPGGWFNQRMRGKGSTRWAVGMFAGVAEGRTRRWRCWVVGRVGSGSSERLSDCVLGGARSVDELATHIPVAAAEDSVCPVSPLASLSASQAVHDPGCVCRLAGRKSGPVAAGRVCGCGCGFAGKGRWGNGRAAVSAA